MAVLTTKKRKGLPKSSFAIPSKRAYPIPDEAHARNANARVSQFGTPAEKKTVNAAVAKKFPQIGKPAKKREEMTAREKIEAGLQEERKSHDKKSKRRK